MFSFSNHCKCFLFLTISNVFFFIFISNVHHHRHPSSDTFLPTPVINLRPYGACQTMMSQWMYLRNTGRSPLLLPFCFYFLLYLEVDSINFYQFNRRKIYVLSNNAVTCDGFDFYSSFTDFDVNKYKSDFIPYCHCIIGICIQNFRYNVQTYALILLYINIHVCFCLYYVNISFLLPLHMEVYFGDGVV